LLANDNSNNNNDNVGLEDSSKESISITVNRPYKLSCSWKELYYVSIISPYREVKGEGLYEKGTQAVIYASEQIDLGLGKRAYFAGWQGDINDKSNILSITVDKPYKIVAVWNEDSTQQYIVLAILSMSVISASIMYIKGRVK
jgi:plasmid maintenance system killer protein